MSEERPEYEDRDSLRVVCLVCGAVYSDYSEQVSCPTLTCVTVRLMNLELALGGTRARSIETGNVRSYPGGRHARV